MFCLCAYYSICVQKRKMFFYLFLLYPSLFVTLKKKRGVFSSDFLKIHKQKRGISVVFHRFSLKISKIKFVQRQLICREAVFQEEIDRWQVHLMQRLKLCLFRILKIVVAHPDFFDAFDECGELVRRLDDRQNLRVLLEKMWVVSLL